MIVCLGFAGQFNDFASLVAGTTLLRWSLLGDFVLLVVITIGERDGSDS